MNGDIVTRADNILPSVTIDAAESKNERIGQILYRLFSNMVYSRRPGRMLHRSRMEEI